MRFDKLIAAVVTTMALVPAGHASNVLEEIVVTAQKREQAITDVPLSVTAITQEGLEAQGATDILSLPKLVPGAVNSRSFSPAQAILNMRGTNTPVGTDPTTAYYIDDTPFSVVGLAIGPSSHLYDVNRMEVIRGPQGTLYGQGAMGGTVRVLTNDPDASDRFGGNIRLRAMNTADGEPSYSGDIALNIPLVEDVLAARLSGTRLEQGGFIDDVATNKDDVNDNTFTDVRGKILYTPNDKLLIRASHWYSDVEDFFGNQTTTFDAGDRELASFGGVKTINTMEVSLSSLFLSYDLGFATLENSLSYMDFEAVQISSLNGIQGFAPTDSDALTNELRLVSNGEGNVRWIAGVLLREAERNTFADVDLFILPFVNPAWPAAAALATSYTSLDSSVTSIFGEVTFEFMDGFLEVLVGARYFEDERESIEDVDPLENPISILGVPVFGAVADQVENRASLASGKTTFDSFNPRFNVAMYPTEEAMVYVNAAKGYRSGFFNTALGQAGATFLGLTADFSTVEPDEIWTYELGTKILALDNTLQFDAAIFYSDWQDKISQYSTPVFATLFTNSGDAEILGLEFSLVYSGLADGLTLSLSGTWLDTELDVPDELENPGTQFVDGAEIEGTPDSAFNLMVDYVRPWGALELQFHADYIWRASSTDSTGGLNHSRFGYPLETGSYSLLGLRAGIAAPEDWKVTLFVNNALDDDNVTSYFFSQFTGVNRPREIGVSFKKHF